MPSILFASSASLVVALGCSKPAANQETAPVEAQQRVAVPGARGTTGAPTMTMTASEPASKGTAGDDDPFRLKADEGKLAIEAPANATSGTEVVARVLVTPGSAFKINTEFPTKLTLEAATGVTMAKALLVAGGHDKDKGDAAAFDERQLAFDVKLTPSQPGDFKINGTFKFAVCDKDTCLAKKEAITIAFAAK